MSEMRLARRLIVGSLAVLVMGLSVMLSPSKASAAAMECSSQTYCVYSLDECQQYASICSTCPDGDTFHCDASVGACNGYMAYCAWETD